MSSGVKRDACTAELPDEDEQGGKFQQTAEGVDEEMVKAVEAGKKKELDVTEVFGIFDVCEECQRMRRLSQRNGKAFRKTTSGYAGS